MNLRKGKDLNVNVNVNKGGKSLLFQRFNRKGLLSSLARDRQPRSPLSILPSLLAPLSLPNINVCICAVYA